MMFASNSPYSPFFTSGLLSHSIFDGIRRGSLPTDNPKDSQSQALFSNQPEYRSFLSLDLAESQSMRSASLKRKRVAPLKLSDSDSLRSMPSPKPAPSATLPEVPKSAPPRIPSLTPIPALDVPLPSLTISRTPAPPTAIRRLSVATKATSSSVSTHVRKSNRSQALARLEGRSKHVPITLHIKPLNSQQCNFMNMSDDEDGEDDCICLDVDNVFSNPVLEPEDVVLPTSRTSRFPTFPCQNDPFIVTSARSARRHKTQVPSTKDWLHLTSFMDLHTDDDSSSWAWRSFIQVANVP